MLVLTRKKGQSLVIGDQTHVTVLEVTATPCAWASRRRRKWPSNGTKSTGPCRRKTAPSWLQGSWQQG